MPIAKNQKKAKTYSLISKCFILLSLCLCFVILYLFRTTVFQYFNWIKMNNTNLNQLIFDRLYFAFGNIDFYAAVIGSTLITVVVFWTFNFGLLLLDIFNWPDFLMQYKIQPDKNVPVDKKRLLSVICTALFNQSVIGFPAMTLAYYAYQWRGCPMTGELPPVYKVVIDLLAFALIEEILFYYSHRILHHPIIYKHVHKKHHEWTAPIGIVALYAHPIEHIVSNLMPILIGPFVMCSHLMTIWIWFNLAILITSVHHSGYHFPLLPSPEAHDFHHYKFTNNFGVLGILDRIHNTDNLFRASKAYERHILLTSKVSLRRQIPDR